MPETKPYPRAKPKVRVLGKEKLKVFLEAASKNPWYLEILLGLFCGLRKGEILGLKFQDFDFEKQTVRISRQIVGNLKVKEQEFTITEYAVIERNPKTENSYRILRVPKVVMREVKHRQQLIDKRKADMGVAYKDYDYVSCQENGEPRSLTAMNQALTKICNRNGLPNITAVSYTHLDVYKRQRLGCGNYSPTHFGLSLPEVTEVRNNEDGTIVLTIHAVCDSVVCNDRLLYTSGRQECIY